jgi:glyoxylase-like metal-dependent hydrolase (beta-lactamase superfamily II)
MPAVPAPLESVRVGDVRITWLPDGVGRFKPTAFVVPSTDEEWARHPDAMDSNGMMVCSLGGVLVETPSHTVLVDTGVGEHKVELPIGSSEGGQFLHSLSAAGTMPEKIDTLVFTHMQADHVGWAGAGHDGDARLRFSNAQHVMHRDEWKHWEGKDDHIGMPKALEDPMRDNVRLIGGDDEIVPGLNLVHTPGHTPGHSTVVVTSGDQRVYILGDVIHSPTQVSENWMCFADTDPAQSRATRDALMKALAKPGTLTAGTHFPNSIFGRVLITERKPRWVMGTSAKPV